MTGPLDAVMAIHNASRRDMGGLTLRRSTLHEAKWGSRLRSNASDFSTKCWFGTPMARNWPFSPVEAVALAVAEAYERDHRGLDAAFDDLNAAVSSRDALVTARATAAFKFHLDVHLGKEDAHLYRIMRERVSVPDRDKAVRIMANTVPQDRFPELVAWMYHLMGHEDHENMTRIWQMVMPPPAFAQAKQLIQKAIGND